MSSKYRDKRTEIEGRRKLLGSQNSGKERGRGGKKEKRERSTLYFPSEIAHRKGRGVRRPHAKADAGKEKREKSRFLILPKIGRGGNNPSRLVAGQVKKGERRGNS